MLKAKLTYHIVLKGSLWSFWPLAALWSCFTTSRGQTTQSCWWFHADLQVAVTHQDMLQCANKSKEEEDRKLINMNVNDARFLYIKEISFCKCFMRMEINSTCLLDLKDAHNVFWWLTLNAGCPLDSQARRLFKNSSWHTQTFCLELAVNWFMLSAH